MTRIKISELKKSVRKTLEETLIRVLYEDMSPEDKWAADEQGDEDMSYEMGI